MAWPPRARNLVLEANNSNWYDWYEDFMAEFGRNAAAVAIDPESKAPDGTLYTDKEAMREALKAADWPIPERPVRPVLGDDDEESLEKYLDEYEAYLSDRELRLVHKRRVHEDYYSAAAAILQYVPKHVFCDLLADIESPRGQLAALRANFASFEPFLGLKRDLEYEALQATYSWTAVEDWIPKWAELIRKLQQVDSSVVHDHRYLGDLSNLLTNSSAPASQTAGLILQVVSKVPAEAPALVSRSRSGGDGNNSDDGGSGASL
ncbi:hypothetical protein F503_03253 [Ophiostoma piceae UAMH 11346]|uniref:Uncharacterized protein n=1 Tax=Ophiostoma piceae (strain UAMH 11346) TaxID=1262450 RepID=S3C4Q7_OPHP1|nr:hypothetical protein F503_03253 [Ophiostoma piceae UAMH 11346]